MKGGSKHNNPPLRGVCWVDEIGGTALSGCLNTTVCIGKRADIGEGLIWIWMEDGGRDIV